MRRDYYMEKFKKFFKELDITNKVLLIGSFTVIILMILDFVLTLDYIIKFENKTRNTNGRWLQVEEIINGTGERVDSLNKRIDELQKPAPQIQQTFITPQANVGQNTIPAQWVNNYEEAKGANVYVATIFMDKNSTSSRRKQYTC